MEGSPLISRVHTRISTRFAQMNIKTLKMIMSPGPQESSTDPGKCLADRKNSESHMPQLYTHSWKGPGFS